MTERVSNYDLQVDIAKKIFLEYDQERMIRKFSLEADGQYLYLHYLNTPCRIHRKDGTSTAISVASRPRMLLALS